MTCEARGLERMSPRLIKYFKNALEIMRRKFFPQKALDVVRGRASGAGVPNTMVLVIISPLAEPDKSNALRIWCLMTSLEDDSVTLVGVSPT